MSPEDPLLLILLLFLELIVFGGEDSGSKKVVGDILGPLDNDLSAVGEPNDTLVVWDL